MVDFYSQRLIVVAIKRVQSISVVLHYIEYALDLLFVRGVKIPHSAAHHIHKSLQIIVFLLCKVIADGVAFDKVVF